MRRGLTLGIAVLGWMGMACVASSTPEANGYNVQLYFDGAPLGSPMTVGDPGVVTVRRIETQLDRCAQSSGSCNPTAVTPIALISASCDDDLCTLTPQAADTSGAIALEATGKQPGATTLRVRVRSVIDGSEWDDGYPLVFRAPTLTQIPAPIVVGRHHSAD